MESQAVFQAKIQAKNVSVELGPSIILVLFDLEEYGTQGSMAFVQDFLVPSIVKKMGFPGVMGAYILDSVMAFNDTADSQVVTHLHTFID